MQRVFSVRNGGIFLIILLTIFGCGSKDKSSQALPFDEIADLPEIAATLAQPVAFSAKIEARRKDAAVPGEMVLSRGTSSRLKLERDPGFELTLSPSQLTQGSQIFDLNAPDNLDWLRIGELFVLEPNLLPFLKQNFNFKTASPLDDLLFVTAYPKTAGSKIELVVFKISKKPLRILTADVLLRTGDLACRADYSEFVQLNGAEIATQIKVSWLVEWKPVEETFYLTDVK